MQGKISESARFATRAQRVAGIEPVAA